ncbi:hypothetical protein NL676_018809 [Syzygium grande]|nr:hypothetical protein NL676_018809 [Syzygium grande]
MFILFLVFFNFFYFLLILFFWFLISSWVNLFFLLSLGSVLFWLLGIAQSCDRLDVVKMVPIMRLRSTEKTLDVNQLCMVAQIDGALVTDSSSITAERERG